jgi:hypothetical protein
MTAAIEFARRFHDAYEMMAPVFGYETREQTRHFDPESPNGKLMVAVIEKLVMPLVEEAKLSKTYLEHVIKILKSDQYEEIILPQIEEYLLRAGLMSEDDKEAADG